MLAYNINYDFLNIGAKKKKWLTMAGRRRIMERRGGIMTGGKRRQKRRRQLESTMKDPSNLNDCGVSTIIHLAFILLAYDILNYNIGAKKKELTMTGGRRAWIRVSLACVAFIY